MFEHRNITKNKMAEDALGKSVDQLKKERTVARGSFTKQANFLKRSAADMSELELKSEFAILSVNARRVFETNDDYRAGLEAELQATEKDGEEAELDKDKESNLESVANECSQKFNELKSIVQTNLWTRYGRDALQAAFDEAEKACSQADRITIESDNCEAYEVHLAVLENLT